jgi:hypothetical protein
VGHERWFYWYAAVVMGASFAVYALMPETRDTSRIVEE